MNLIHLILQNFFSFIFIISLIVFIHEFGHFFVARLCGVKVDEFSIGFGRELFGFFDKKGTRWKICLLPLGGYVKMFGDRNGASMPDIELLKNMSAAEKKQSFLGKNVWQRMAIVAAGPVANFLLAILLFTFLFKINGLNTALPIVDEVMSPSAAFDAGLQKGDKILQIGDRQIDDFEEVRSLIVSGGEQELIFKIERNKNIIDVKITPKIQSRKDFFGEEAKVVTLGIAVSEVSHQDLNLAQSFVEANKETYRTSIAIFKAVGELITGKRDFKELGGPIKIAKYSGKTMEMGITVVMWFMAMISLNLGVMNLLPVPVLDGGHLFFYFIEAIFKKPLPQKIQKFGFQIGMSLVLALMIFTTINDIRQLIFGS
jgi:regulator of sigma E protease